MENIQRKIIYVDDVKFSLLSLKNRLKEQYEIRLAESVSVLFEILESFKPDLILLDINMPEVNGYESIKKLKADERYADIPVIFLTGRGDRESILEGIRLGAADYVSKPFSCTELVERIESQFNQGPSKKEIELPNIIYVDDVNFNLLSVKSRLKSRYAIYPAQSVPKLFELLEHFKPDLILLDVEMPGMNGFEGIKRLKADERYADIPVIFLTGRDDKESVLDGLKLGAVDYVRKPFSDAELIKRINFQLNFGKYGPDDSTPTPEPFF